MEINSFFQIAINMLNEGEKRKNRATFVTFCEISTAWKRKDEVNITRLQRSSSFASRISFYFRIAVLSQSCNIARKVIVRNHFYAFAALTLMMKRLSTLLGTPSFHSSIDDYNQLPVVYPTSHWICVISLMLAQPDFDIVLYFFPHYL